MIKFSKNLVIIILSYFFIATTSSFGSISSEFINDIVNKASNILSSKKTKELKIKELIKIGEESADIDGIGLLRRGKRCFGGQIEQAHDKSDTQSGSMHHLVFIGKNSKRHRFIEFPPQAFGKIQNTIKFRREILSFVNKQMPPVGRSFL